MSFIQKHRLLTVPQLHKWSVSVLHSQATSGTEPPNIGSNGRVQKTGKRQEPISSQAPIKRVLNIREARDALFANTAGGTFGAKFDAFVDEILPDCGIADTANFVRIAGKRSRINAAFHLVRRLPDIACRLESLASSAWEFKEISFILHGTQSCKESNDGYLSIMMTMSKIVTKTTQKREAISSQTLAMILYGLRSNKFKGKESKKMLSCLPRIVEKCSESLSAQDVGNALYGLQGMSSDDADVGLLVLALSGQVSRCTEAHNAQAVGNALYGLQSMFSTVDGQDLGLLLLRSFMKSHEAAGIVDYTSEDLSCCQSVAVTLPFLKDHVTEGEVKECERIINDIENKTRVSVFNEHGDPATNVSFQSRGEQCMQAGYHEGIGEVEYAYIAQRVLFGIFECDIVVRVPRGVNARTGDDGQNRSREGEESLTINIEVDGVHHRRENKKRFCRMRDEYLQSRGVVIARIEVSALNAMNEQDLKKWITDIAAKALFL